MKNVLGFWLDKGAAGFRVDAVNFLMEDEELRDEEIDNPDDPLAYSYTRKDHTRDLVSDSSLWNFNLNFLIWFYFKERKL